MVPIPVILVNDTAVPAFAKLAAVATCIISLSTFIAKTVDGSSVVRPIPGTSVLAIPIDD